MVVFDYYYFFFFFNLMFLLDFFSLMGFICLQGK